MALNVSSVDTVLANTAAVVASSTALTQATILKCSVVNTDTAPHAITVYRVPLGNSPAVGYEIIQNAVVGASATVVLPLAGQVLFGGQTLQAMADTGSVVNFNISLATTP